MSIIISGKRVSISSKDLAYDSAAAKRAHLALVDAYCNTMLGCVVRRRDDDCGGGGQVQYGRRSNGDEQDDGRPRHPRH
jgi:hypothetical protein